MSSGIGSVEHTDAYEIKGIRLPKKVPTFFFVNFEFAFRTLGTGDVPKQPAPSSPKDMSPEIPQDERETQSSHAQKTPEFAVPRRLSPLSTPTPAFPQGMGAFINP